MNTVIENILHGFHELPFYLQLYLDQYTFLFPIGIIGIWRWSVWMMKEIVGLHYRPKTKAYYADVSIVTPVYNENPKVFTHALESWKNNNPAEIIAVIDYTDQACINVFKEFQTTFPGAVLIITEVPGKRPALADGILRAKSEIVALVDSDTIWEERVIRNGLPPFHDWRVAGVATYQSVLHPKTFAQKVFDVQLDLRYRHEYPFLAAFGGPVVCLSGRTAFYRREVILSMIPDLVDERFLGKPVISGDDKRLTYLVLAAGWKVAYQSNSHVYTPGMRNLGAYLKQRLRWTRNSLRADLGAIRDGWPLRHPALLFFQIDKFLQSFVVILSPIYFFVSVYFHLWTAALVILCWWFISRSVKMYPHLALKPHNIFIVPGYVLYSFFTGILKIYAFFTLNTQGWITRWDKSRLPQLKFLRVIPAYIATVWVITLLTYFVYLYKQQTYIIPLTQKEDLLAAALPFSTTASANEVVLGTSTVDGKQLLTKRYKVTGKETLPEIAKKFGVSEDQLLYANSAKLPYQNSIAPGTVLTIPGKGMQLTEQKNFSFRKPSPVPLVVRYNKATNTLLITGRGKHVTLRDIRNNGGKEYLEEVAPKVWYAKATIFIYHGVTLELDKREVEWLKLESNKKRFVVLRSVNGDILVNGVKITSWDEEKNDYDKELEDGRSFIMVKDNARMDIYNAEVGYLGFAPKPNMVVSPYGVSWKLSRQNLKKVLLTGAVVNSKFHHNYFGAYTFGATGMTWLGNEFYNNVKYGLDPHDDSNGFLVENNRVHDNGSHGIIFSKRCMYNTISNNVSYNNKLHGIMLHEKSDFNIIEDNILTGNTSGVALWRSSNNIVRNNRTTNNRNGVRANVASNNNTIQNNHITGNKLYGVYFYDNANNNLIHNNTLEHNNVGMYVKSDSNEISKNSLLNNTVGIYLKDKASNNILVENQIKQSLKYGIYTKVATQVHNTLGYNNFYKNRKDIAGVVNTSKSDKSEDEGQL